MTDREIYLESLVDFYTDICDKQQALIKKLIDDAKQRPGKTNLVQFAQGGLVPSYVSHVSCPREEFPSQSKMEKEIVIPIMGYEGTRRTHGSQE